MAIVAAGLLASGCGAAEQASVPQPAGTSEQATLPESTLPDSDRAARLKTSSILRRATSCRSTPLPPSAMSYATGSCSSPPRDEVASANTPVCLPSTRARASRQERAAAALRAAMKGIDCGAKTPLVCPRPTAVPSQPQVPTLEEAETTLRAAMKGVECDADAVLAAQFFLEAVADGRQQVESDDLHITDRSLPECTDDHLPDDAPTTPEEAEAMPDPPDGTECDASRGGTITLCRGRHVDCVTVGEYTGPPRE
jgi:hypothetical protein